MPQILLNNSLLFVELPAAATSPVNNVAATSTSLTAEQIQNLKALQECPIALQSIYQTTQAKKFEGKIPMKKRKPTQTTTQQLTQQPLQVLTPTLYPSSLNKIPASTKIQIISQPSDRKPIIIPQKMEVTIQPIPLPQPTIVKIEKNGDEEDEEVTHFEITSPINISSINSLNLNSSLQFSSNSVIPTIKFCNSSSSIGVNVNHHKSSSSSSSSPSSSLSGSATSSSSLATTTPKQQPSTSPGKT